MTADVHDSGAPPEDLKIRMLGPIDLRGPALRFKMSVSTPMLHKAMAKGWQNV